MTTFKQIEANRRNARRSTGPITEEGKLQSRRNAVRHGLTAETVIGALEDAEDYRAFEAAVIADNDAQSAVERELVLRLASLLWRIRRATTMETGLFEIQARHVLEYREKRDAQQSSIRRFFGSADGLARDSSRQAPDHGARDLAQCYLRLANLPTFPLDRLSRYEAALWRQAAQTMFTLSALRRRKPWETGRRFRPDRSSINDID
jgi:hypothetical protein